MSGTAVTSSFRSRLARWAAPVLDLLLPPLCLVCYEPIGSHQALCPQCWKKIRFITSPCCGVCGMPFDFSVEEGTQCGECLAHPPSYTRARSALIYDEASKRLVLGFKHNDRIHTVPALAAWMHRAGSDFWETADLLVPVPLHRWRLFRRRYNQAALLALELGRLTQKLVAVDLLERMRATPIQGHMNREERRKNVAGAITYNSGQKIDVKGKSIVLVDDVLTTGATVNECARVLLKNGAVQVNVLTLARTLRLNH